MEGVGHGHDQRIRRRKAGIETGAEQREPDRRARPRQWRGRGITLRPDRSGRTKTGCLGETHSVR